VSGSILLDTTIAIDHLRNGNKQLVAHLQAGGLAYLPVIALGELCAGVERSPVPSKTLAEVWHLKASVTLLYADDVTAANYGKIYGQLSRAGTPIPQNDIWIAAFALEYQMPLATKDPHFGRVDGLVVLAW